MIVVDVEFGKFSQNDGVGKTPRQLHWPNRVIRSPRSDAAEAVISLDNEISNLRQKMEDAFVQGDSLTSGKVMELSRLLDVKINEYMKVLQKD